MPRTKKVDDQLILKRALAVICKQGAATFSLEDLRAATGLSPATLIQRFGSKRNILYKAIELANENLNEKFTQRPLGKKSPLQELIAIYLEQAGAFLKPADVAGGLDILKLDITEKKLNTLTRAYFEIRRNKMESLLRLAQEQGYISRARDISELVWSLESLWQGSIMLWAMIGKGELREWLEKRLNGFLELLS